MPIPARVREEILSAITQLGKPATITEIEKEVPFERHTLSKYLGVMKREGTLDYHTIGRAKLWEVNSTPLKHIFEADPEDLSFTELLFTRLLKALPIGIFILKEDFTIQFMNDLMKEMYGDGQAKHFCTFMLGSADPMRLGPIRDVVVGDADFAEMSLHDQKGNILDIRAQTFEKPDKTPLAVLIIEDITYQQQVEKAIRHSERFYKSLVEVSPNGIYALDIRGNVTFASTHILKLLGYDLAEEVMGRPVFDFIIKKDHVRAQQHMNDLLTKDVGAMKYTLVGKSGKKIVVEMKSIVLKSEEGKPEGYVGYINTC